MRFFFDTTEIAKPQKYSIGKEQVKKVRRLASGKLSIDYIIGKKIFSIGYNAISKTEKETIEGQAEAIRIYEIREDDGVTVIGSYTVWVNPPSTIAITADIWQVELILEEQ